MIFSNTTIISLLFLMTKTTMAYLNGGDMV